MFINQLFVYRPTGHPARITKIITVISDGKPEERYKLFGDARLLSAEQLRAEYAEVKLQTAGESV